MSRAKPKPGALERLRKIVTCGAPLEGDCIVNRMDLLQALGEVDYLRGRLLQAHNAGLIPPPAAATGPAAPESPLSHLNPSPPEKPVPRASVHHLKPGGYLLTPGGQAIHVRECALCGHHFDHEALGPAGCPNCHGEGLQ